MRHHIDLIDGHQQGARVDQCGLLVWDAMRFRPLGPPLLSHGLTVTQLQYSHNDLYLCSTSRDRSFTIFKANQAGKHFPF